MSRPRPPESRPAPRRRRSGRRGYVLLLTLLVLALAAVVLAGVCRGGLQLALHAGRAEAELQRRWGVLSCRRTFLPNADRLLAAAEREAGRPLASVRREVTLNNRAYSLVVSDEQSKLNVNALVRDRGKAQAERSTRDLLRAGGIDARVRFLAGAPAPAGPAGGDGADDADPDADPGGYEVTDRPLQSYGQVFPDVPPAGLFGPRGPAELVTCWGYGTVDFRRAPEAVLRATCETVLDARQVRRLLALRGASPDADLFDTLDRMDLPDDTLEALEARLTDDSTCHSLWIAVAGGGAGGGAPWYHFAVRDGSVGANGATLLLAW